MPTSTLSRTPTFIPLNNKVFAEYSLVYRINDAYTIKDFAGLINKHQLLFQKFENKQQQLNLMFVDSVFVNILADVAVGVLLNKVNSFASYMSWKDKSRPFAMVDEGSCFAYKFSDFIHLMLYGDIASTKPYKQELHTDRVFCFKNETGELEYFSIYEQQVLQNILLQTMKLEVDYDRSSIDRQEVKVWLRMRM
jgi:hypothetical protein